MKCAMRINSNGGEAMAAVHLSALGRVTFLRVTAVAGIKNVRRQGRVRWVRGALVAGCPALSGTAGPAKQGTQSPPVGGPKPVKPGQCPAGWARAKNLGATNFGHFQ